MQKLPNIFFIKDRSKINQIIHDNLDIIIHKDLLETEIFLEDFQEYQYLLEMLDINTNPKLHIGFDSGEIRLLSMISNTLDLKEYQSMVIYYPEKNLHENIHGRIVSILKHILPAKSRLFLFTRSDQIMA